MQWGNDMAEQNAHKLDRRKRINRMKQVLLVLAVILILASIGLNIVLLFRVIHLNQLVQQIYGALLWIPLV